VTLKVIIVLFEMFVYQIPQDIQDIISTMYIGVNLKVHMACNLNYLFENKGLMCVIASHIHCKCGNGMCQL